ncbi:MAG: HAD family hydrolase [Limnochordia bacterium]|nr:HAD family hydrolase [Limnochordia bacterium]
MTQKQRAVFLDRDGVLNKSIGKRPPNNQSELTLLPGVPQAVAELNKAGFLAFVVTNQGGVGLGYMTPEDLRGIHAKLAQEVAAAGGHFTEMMACTHRPKAGCACRKPKPGMLLRLAGKYNVDLAQSFMIGDRDMDIAAGKAAGTKTILIASDEKTEQVPDYTCPDLLTASRLLKDSIES